MQTNIDSTGDEGRLIYPEKMKYNRIFKAGTRHHCTDRLMQRIPISDKYQKNTAHSLKKLYL